MISVVEKSKSAVITVSAKDLKSAFAEGGRGLFRALYDTDRMHPTERVEFAIDAESLSALYKAWLTQLIDRARTDNLIFSECVVMSLQKVSAKQYVLMGSAEGETADAKRKKAEFKSISDVSCKEGKEKSECCANVSFA